MNTAVAHKNTNTEIVTLFIAFELSSKQWKLGFTIGFGQKPRLRTITAGDLEVLQKEIRAAKERFGLPEDAPVLSCYEAGRDGFWIHRYLTSIGVTNLVVSSSSIEVPRKGRKRKTDRLDVTKLLTMLMRHHIGDPRVWSVVRVPSVKEEDRRQLNRELEALGKERKQHICRIKSLLVCHGIRMKVGRDFLGQMESARKWDGSSLPEGLVVRLKREYKRLQMVDEHIREINAERWEIIRHDEAPEIDMVRQLFRLKSIGINSAWQFTMELFAWRKFRNGKEIGGLTGLAPTMKQSGDDYIELGIGKDGLPNVRWMAVEIAWKWLYWQPDSELSRWFWKRFGHGSKRMRRIGIVAVARKLLVALWRYLETGEIPEGAVLKDVVI
jgi:transposase